MWTVWALDDGESGLAAGCGGPCELGAGLGPSGEKRLFHAKNTLASGRLASHVEKFAGGIATNCRASIGGGTDGDGAREEIGESGVDCSHEALKLTGGDAHVFLEVSKTKQKMQLERFKDLH